jgi:hypothetical protein
MVGIVLRVCMLLYVRDGVFARLYPPAGEESR